jgi:AcrR family transcriptional regulator
MSPRPYKLGQRRLATDQTRSRIVTAARELLADENGPPGFTVDAVARQAGVARMTVYYQFQSKRGVLEALFDDLANRGLMPHLFPVFQEPVPARALDGLIGAFAAFWNSDRIVLRRARALVALDPEMADSIRERDERRREHLRKIVERLFAEKGKDKQKGAVPAAALRSIIDVLHMLTSFETFDALLTGERSVEEVTRIVRHLAATALDLRAD